MIENDTNKIMVFPNLLKLQPDSIHLHINLPSYYNDLDPLRDPKGKRKEKENKIGNKEKKNQKKRQEKIVIYSFFLLFKLIIKSTKKKKL